MKDGHLFLATTADGSIIEFESMEIPLAATVLGEDVAKLVETGGVKAVNSKKRAGIILLWQPFYGHTKNSPPTGAGGKPNLSQR